MDCVGASAQRRLPWLFRLPSDPIIDLFANVIHSEAVSLANLVLELITSPVDDSKVVLAELAPLFFDLPFGLLPVSFNAVPVHCP